MAIPRLSRCAAACLLLLALPVGARAQIVESVGSRAQGMGGAFVAVANDSSANWWNPAGLADGPFLDLALLTATTELHADRDAQRHGTSGISFGIPPLGISYYRLRITDLHTPSPTGNPAGGREEGQAGVPVGSWSASQVGVTIVRTLSQGIHAGATVRYVRGTLRAATGNPGDDVDDLLDFGDDL